MKLKIKDRQLFLDNKYLCDTSFPRVASGNYKIVFEHSSTFNAIMPILKGIPDQDEVLICWCRELCRTEKSCAYCNSIQVGKRSVKGELIECRSTFNQVYEDIHKSRSKDLMIEII